MSRLLRLHPRSQRSAPAPTPTVTTSPGTESTLGTSGTQDPQSPPAARFLSEEECRVLVAQVASFVTGRVRPTVRIESTWEGNVRWARNRIALAGERQTNAVTLLLSVNRADGVEARAQTNEIDPASLQGAVRWAQRALRLAAGSSQPDDFAWAPVTQSYPHTHIWSEATYAQAPEARSLIATQLIESAERAGMVSAGDLVVAALGISFQLGDDRFVYASLTNAQCSLTVRDPQGIGSGWAGCSSYDWTRLDAAKLAAVALEKCLASRNPVAIEPGRYTTILEPQAAFEFVRSVVTSAGRDYAEKDRTSPYHISRQHTKLGQQVVDARLRFSFDPRDPDLGVIPFTYDQNEADNGDPVVPVTWIDHGILTNLGYSRQWALEHLQEAVGKPLRAAFRLSWSEAPVSLEEMIATTTRGLWVTRFWDVNVNVQSPARITRGMTRDGVWLIERGKISKPVKNMRFVESPFAALNNLEQVGTPVPVFSPYPAQPALVPPLKVRDFSFTALTDAI